METDLIVSFKDKDVSLALVGGKGLNLAKLTQSNFQVPSGFIITTHFYRKFVEYNSLEDVIKNNITSQSSNDFDFEALEQISTIIREQFTKSTIPPDLLNQVVSAYDALQGDPVAVRSSATAEDLKDLSFAGQHDTVLNVIGNQALETAIITCLGSLW